MKTREREAAVCPSGGGVRGCSGTQRGHRPDSFMDPTASKPVPKRFRNKTCYACESQAVSDDHVPPRFLFPEQKDLGHKYGNLRQGLITVPACMEHNTDQSGDDKYFVQSIITYDRNNEIAQDHFATKVERSIEKDRQVAKWYAQMVLIDGRLVERVGRLDMDRMERSVNKIVKGLYYRITGQKIMSSKLSNILYPDLLISEPSLKALYMKLERRLQQGTYSWIQYPAGSPRVFTAQYWIDDTNLSRLAFNLQFYEGFRVWATHAGEQAQVGAAAPRIT